VIITIEQIKAARSLLGWTQRDLAKQAGISLASMANLEQGMGKIGGRVIPFGHATEQFRYCTIAAIGGLAHATLFSQNLPASVPTIVAFDPGERIA
jgi:predicted transcriptional regulator